MCPLQRMDRGHLAGSRRQMDVWLYTQKVRWFWMRSFPDDRRSKGYQKSNSRFILRRSSGGTPESSGGGPSSRMYSHTESVTAAAGTGPADSPP